jgi:hypothetical protein
MFYIYIYMPVSKKFWNDVEDMYERVRGRSGSVSNAVDEEIDKMVGRYDVDDNVVRDFKTMTSKLEDIFNDDDGWVEAHHAIIYEKRKRYFKHIVTAGASGAVGVVTTPFKYMARAVAGFAFIGVARRASRGANVAINDQQIAEIDEKLNNMDEDLVKIEEKLKIVRTKDDVNDIVDIIPNEDVKSKSKFKREAPSILLFLLLSGFVYYMESGIRGGGMKKRKKQTRKSKRKGRRRRRRTRKY